MAAGAGPTYVVIGNCGATLTDAGQPDPTPPMWKAVVFEHGYARLAADAGSLRLQALRAADGGVLDQFELVKQAATV